MTPLEQRTIEHWQEAAHDLGFRFVAPFTLDDAGQTLMYLGWLPQFGGGHGMLIITADSLDAQQRLMDAARARDFAYSCMSASDEPYDRDVIIDVLNDWGWSSSEPAPSWHHPSPDCHV
jgi:hypothetical protein